MKKGLLIIGNDKIGKQLFFELQASGIDLSHFALALDCSTNPVRIGKLLIKHKLNFRCFFQMVFSEIKRQKFPLFEFDYKLRSNEDLLAILINNDFKIVYLFRAGLIINKINLSLGVKFYNIHCATIPDYAGLCSIYRALKEAAFDQKACIHKITTKIDDAAEVIDTEEYTLDPNKTYFRNEEIAYNAGIKLLQRAISNVE